jgi:DNA adenine methylase
MLKDWKTDYYVRDPAKLDSLTSAAYYYFNHNLSYGPMYLGWISKIYQDQSKWDKMVDYVRGYRNNNLQVNQASFDDVIGGSEFLYLRSSLLFTKG